MHPVVPLLSCAALVLAWGLVAHNSGAGWVQAVGDVLAGILLVGLVAPAVACGRARVQVLDSPTDGTAGMPVELMARASSRVRVRPLHPAGPEAFVGPHFAARPSRGTAAPASPLSPGDSTPARRRDDHGALTLLPERRGVHEDAVIELSSAAPFGLLWWRKTVRVALPRPLHVGPRMGEPFSFPRGMHDAAVGDTVATPAPFGEPRAVRPYRSGDLRRFVHWPATAHRGELMVREMESPAAEPVTVEVRLPPEPDAAEKMAERALATVVTLVDRGASVLLATIETDGAHVAAVGDRRSAGRRLARAVAGPGPGR